ncbi:MAG: hypothetical protein JOZ82_13585 [Marmoricola sp.]|nr:hypothetical protein [Marmoricola sp.]
MSSSRSEDYVDRARQAGARAQSAGRRAAALHARLETLITGGGSTTWTLDMAQAARDQSAADAASAVRSALVAYSRAAGAHRSVAAMARSVGDVDLARRHSDCAAADDERASLLARSIA